MLIQFSVKNFRSFKEEATLSMVASSIKERKTENTFQISKDISLLKSTVIYGANASGKSNLFRAMTFMKMFIFNSSKETQASEPIPTERFKLNTETESQPSFFEIIFAYKKVQYRYGFAVTDKEVVEEWLYYIPNIQELEVFTRKGQDFKLSHHFKSEETLVQANRIRPNALFLSVSAQFNGEIARSMMEWFSLFNCISGDFSKPYESIAIQLYKNTDARKSILDFLKRADLGIDNFNIVEKKAAEINIPPEFQAFIKDKNNFTQINVKTSHLKYDSKGNVTGAEEFDMDKEESNGTQKIFHLCGPFIDTLSTGKILVIDELDARIHPNLIRAICELFNSQEFNPHNAQLIFASHNTSILDKNFLRRDQIWFTQKDRFGASELFSLVEFRDPINGKKIRNDASYEKSYLNGIYGAVPHIRDFEVINGDR
ncbi:MAG: ATP-binding protein [Candidatus Omnitrophica bacterium]|nr:ATP-binding protein [Candidatus Omnitrophota bacterium]